MEPAVSVRPCLKTHEILTEVHHGSNSSLKVCLVVEDEMDEEIMDDKEDQSEESRAVRVDKSRRRRRCWPNGKNMNVHTFLIEVGADTVSLHGQSCSSRPKVHKGGRR